MLFFFWHTKILTSKSKEVRNIVGKFLSNIVIRKKEVKKFFLYSLKTQLYISWVNLIELQRLSYKRKILLSNSKNNLSSIVVLSLYKILYIIHFL